MSGYRPKYFELHELMPPDLCKRKRPETLWRLLDSRLLIAADAIRRRYGKMVANTWYWGGKHQYRGFRPANCLEGAELSMHRLGRAVDLVPVQVATEEIREDLRKFCKGEDPYDGRNNISRVENGTAWLHIDTANEYPGDVIEFFNP